MAILQAQEIPEMPSSITEAPTVRAPEFGAQTTKQGYGRIICQKLWDRHLTEYWRFQDAAQNHIKPEARGHYPPRIDTPQSSAAGKVDNNFPKFPLQMLRLNAIDWKIEFSFKNRCYLLAPKLAHTTQLQPESALHLPSQVEIYTSACTKHSMGLTGFPTRSILGHRIAYSPVSSTPHCKGLTLGVDVQLKPICFAEGGTSIPNSASRAAASALLVSVTFFKQETVPVKNCDGLSLEIEVGVGVLSVDEGEEEPHVWRFDACIFGLVGAGPDPPPFIRSS